MSVTVDDLDALRQRLDDLESTQRDHATQLRTISKRTTDFSAIRFTPQMVGAIILFYASLVGGFYAANAGTRDEQAATRSEVITIKAMIAAQVELHKADSKLQDERAQTMADAIKDIKARGEMTDLKVNNLRETVLTTRR